MTLAFSTLRVVPLTEDAREKAGSLLAHIEAKGKTVESRDLFIGGIARHEGYGLVKHNVSHERIPRLQVVDTSRLLAATKILAVSREVECGQ